VLVGRAIGARRITEGTVAACIATWWAVVWMGTIALLLLATVGGGLVSV